MRALTLVRIWSSCSSVGSISSGLAPVRARAPERPQQAPVPKDRDYVRVVLEKEPFEINVVTDPPGAEVLLDGKLVGGLYCVAIGQAVFGESGRARRRPPSPPRRRWRPRPAASPA